MGSLAAAIALKKLIVQRRLNCQIRYYGTTDEGGFGGKVHLAKAGLFNDLDFSIYWHPSPVTAAITHIWDSMFEFQITVISDKKRRIKEDPSLSPLHISDEMRMRIDSLRKTINPDIRINYLLKTNNDHLEEYADTVQVKMIFQHYDQEENTRLFDQTRALLGLSTEQNFQFELIRTTHEFLLNQASLASVYQNMVLLDSIGYTPEELRFIQDYYQSTGQTGKEIVGTPLPIKASGSKKLYGYSSDISEASWFAPKAYFTVTTLPFGAPMHHWQGTIFSGHSIGHKGMIFAAKTMALTIIDYLGDQTLRNRIREEFESKTKDYVYRNFN